MSEIAAVFGLDVRLLLIQAVNFGLVLLVLWYFLYRPVINLIEERRQKIAQGEIDAERAAAKLADADAQKASLITEATQEAERIVAHAREHGKEKEQDLVAQAKARAEQILTEARQLGEEQQRQFMQESKEEIAKMVVLGAEKVLRERRSS